MAIDPSKVQWDKPDVTVTRIGDKTIDPAAVQWDQPPGSEIPLRRTLLQTGQEAITNFPASGQRFARGLYEAVTSPVETLKGLGELLTGAYVRFIPQEWMARPDKAQEFIEKANAVGGVYRDRYGSVEALKNTIATDPVGFLADVSTAAAPAAALPGRAGQVAATVSRYTDPLRFSGVLPVLEKGGEMAMRAGGAALRGGKTNVLLEAVEGRAPEVVNALRAQTEFVPGSMPTAGEAVAELGMGGGKPVTKYPALQAQLSSQLPSEYMQRQLQQDAARVEAIREIGGTPIELETAKKLRDATAQTNYGAAGKQLVTADNVFEGLLTRPSMDKVIQRAATLAAERAKPFVIGKNVPEQRIPSKILSAEGVPMGETVIPAQVQQYPVQSLHFMKMAFDDLIKDPKTFGIGAAEVGAIKGTRSEFLNWVEGKSNAYRVARETFARQSGPINQMEVGRFLENKLVSALQGETQLRPSVFATAVEQAPQTIEKATGGAARYAELSQVLTPAQLKAVESVRKDLAREAAFKAQANAAKAGAPQGTRAGTATAIEVAGGVAAPNVLNNVVTVANAIIKRLAGKIDRKVAMELAYEMLSPEQAALAIEQATRKAEKVSAAGQPIRAISRGAARLATPASVTANALAEAENRNALRPQP